MGQFRQRLGEKGKQALRFGKKVAVAGAIIGGAVLGAKAIHEEKKLKRGEVLHPAGLETKPYVEPKEAVREAPRARDIGQIIAEPKQGISPEAIGGVIEEVGQAVGGKKGKGKALMGAVGVVGNEALFGNPVEGVEEKRKKIEAEARKKKVVYTEKPQDKLKREIREAEEEDRKRREALLKGAGKKKKKKKKGGLRKKLGKQEKWKK